MQDHEQRIIDVLSSDTIIFDSYNTEFPLCISTADTKRELVELLSSCGIYSPGQLIPGKNINPYSIGF